VPEIVQLEKVKRETVRDIIQRGNKDGRKVSIRSQEGVERKRHRIEMIGRLYEL
jgi:hypothetical protein